MQQKMVPRVDSLPGTVKSSAHAPDGPLAILRENAQQRGGGKSHLRCQAVCPLLGSGSLQLRATGPSALRATEAQTLNRALVGFQLNRRELLKLVRQVFQKAKQLLQLLLAKRLKDLRINRV